MKKIMILMALVLGVVAFADDLKINGEFKQVKGNMPVGWIQNKGEWAKPFGTVSIVKATKADENAVKLVSTTKQTPMYTSVTFDVKAGDKLEVKADILGKGKAQLGFYVYGAKSEWVAAVTKSFVATDVKTEAKAVLTIPEGRKDKDGTMISSAKVRVLFAADPNSDITFEDVSAEFAK